MKTLRCGWLGAMLVFTATIATADKIDGDERQSELSILIEPAGLQKALKARSLRIVDTRSLDEYDRGHIPGAVRVDVGEWKDLAIAENGLQDAKGWAEKVGALGISSDARVIVYGSKITNAARIWWLLKYVGVKNASLLNGGWEAWSTNDRPTETSTPQISPTEFKPNSQLDRLAEIDSVKKTLNSEKVKFVDTRSDGEFTCGRIPGSVQLEWKHLLTENGRFKSSKALKEVFRKQGILPTETVVCY